MTSIVQVSILYYVCIKHLVTRHKCPFPFTSTLVVVFFLADDFNLFLAASLWFRFQNGIFTKDPDKCLSSLIPGYFQHFPQIPLQLLGPDYTSFLNLFLEKPFLDIFL